ncbi:sensor histidine kinase [Paenibacillus abyssi]|uniref:Sensor histidine kinase YesM n=1 Tax=Paenibacillus abyssi TaxID=1340531 RepID=A0A917FRX4_9BACL|nr:sensor histidine kinase [Paenibacillus abyssi]GGG00416.1 sensor histidine kinase YesM [Paenibacillus abyssi]
MKKMMPGRYNPTIKRKLMVLVVGHLLLFSVLVYALFFWFQSLLEEKISALALQTMETVIGNVEVYINNNIRLSNTIASDSTLVKLVRENPDFASSESMWSLVQVLEKLKNFSVINQYIYSIAVYNSESGKVLSTTDGIYNAPAGQLEWAEQMKRQGNGLVIGADLNGVVPKYSQGSARSMISVIRPLPGNDRNNLLIVNSDKQVLDLFIGDIELFSGTGIMISDTGGSVFYGKGNLPEASRQPALGKNRSANQPFETVRYGAQKYIAVHKSSDLTGWNVSLIIPHDEIMKDVVNMMRASVLIMIGITVLVLLLFGLLYVQIFTPIRRLMQSMVSVEKGLTFHPVEIRRMDELGFLQQRFNEMVSNEQQMRKTIYEEQLHKKEIELKFLQSQVNPHFLYNTLDSIYWVAEQSGVDEIGDVVLDLSKFFRLSLSRGKDFITIAETVLHLEYYLRIQQFRHTGKFEVVWDVEEQLAQVEVMKLMLQPVVENAIIHGLERAAEACRLTIRIHRQDEWLRCSVEDTGIGMDEQTLKHLLHEIMHDEGPSGTTYGLRNLYQRLHIVYGDDMKFSIRSKPQEGTIVTIRIRLSRLGGKGLEDEGHHR